MFETYLTNPISPEKNAIASGDQVNSTKKLNLTTVGDGTSTPTNSAEQKIALTSYHSAWNRMSPNDQPDGLNKDFAINHFGSESTIASGVGNLKGSPVSVPGTEAQTVSRTESQSASRTESQSASRAEAQPISPVLQAQDGNAIPARRPLVAQDGSAIPGQRPLIAQDGTPSRFTSGAIDAPQTVPAETRLVSNVTTTAGAELPSNRSTVPQEAPTAPAIQPAHTDSAADSVSRVLKAAQTPSDSPRLPQVAQTPSDAPRVTQAAESTAGVTRVSAESAPAATSQPTHSVAETQDAESPMARSRPRLGSEGESPSVGTQRAPQESTAQASVQAGLPSASSARSTIPTTDSTSSAHSTTPTTDSTLSAQVLSHGEMPHLSTVTGLDTTTAQTRVPQESSTGESAQSSPVPVRGETVLHQPNSTSPDLVSNATRGPLDSTLQHTSTPAIELPVGNSRAPQEGRVGEILNAPIQSGPSSIPALARDIAIDCQPQSLPDLSRLQSKLESVTPIHGLLNDVQATTPTHGLLNDVQAATSIHGLLNDVQAATPIHGLLNDVQAATPVHELLNDIQAAIPIHGLLKDTSLTLSTHKSNDETSVALPIHGFLGEPQVGASRIENIAPTANLEYPPTSNHMVAALLEPMVAFSAKEIQINAATEKERGAGVKIEAVGVTNRAEVIAAMLLDQQTTSNSSVNSNAATTGQFATQAPTAQNGQPPVSTMGGDTVSRAPHHDLSYTDQSKREPQAIELGKNEQAKFEPSSHKINRHEPTKPESTTNEALAVKTHIEAPQPIRADRIETIDQPYSPMMTVKANEPAPHSVSTNYPESTIRIAEQTIKQSEAERSWGHEEKGRKHEDKTDRVIETSVVPMVAKRQPEKAVKDIASQLREENERKEEQKRQDNKQERYVVKLNDTLESITKKKLKSLDLITLVYDLNKNKIQFTTDEGKHSYFVRVGTVLWLPSPKQVRNFKQKMLSQQSNSWAQGDRTPAAVNEMRRAQIEKVLGPIFNRDNENGIRYTVRLGDTLRSLAMKHPALNDINLWNLLAEKNGLSTKTDGKGIPETQLRRGTVLVLPLPTEIAEFRKEHAAVAQHENTNFASEGLHETDGFDFNAMNVLSFVPPSNAQRSIGENKLREVEQVLSSTSESLNESCKLIKSVVMRNQSTISRCQLEVVRGSDSIPVVAYEVSESRFVRHEFSQTGTTKSIVIELPTTIAQEMVGNDLDANWSNYCRRFLAGQRLTP